MPSPSSSLLAADSQHFLQDRWSSGHMWERWGPAEYSEIGLATLFEAGMASGIVHGSRSAVTCDHYSNTALLMCEPKIDGGPCAGPPRKMCEPLPPVPNSSNGALWGDGLAADDPKRFGAVGDLYLRQVLAAADADASVNNAGYAQQKGRILTCGQAGWAEVINGFHHNSHPQSYGVLVLRPAPNTHAFDNPQAVLADHGTCWSAWATNASVQQAWRRIVWNIPLFPETIGDLVLRVKTAATTDASGDELASRLAIARVGFMADMAAKLCPNDTDLARGQYPPECVKSSGITDWLKYIFSGEGGGSASVWLLNTVIDIPAGLIVDGVTYAASGVKWLAAHVWGSAPKPKDAKGVPHALACTFSHEFAFGCVHPDNRYHKDDYVLQYADQVEPSKLTDRKNCDTTRDKFAGRDTASIFGFFSRAHVRDWCDPEIVGTLRLGWVSPTPNATRSADIEEHGARTVRDARLEKSVRILPSASIWGRSPAITVTGKSRPRTSARHQPRGSQPGSAGG